MIIDSCVWVAALDPRDSFHQRSRAFFQEIAASETTILVPGHAVLEVACAVSRRLGSPEQGRTLAVAFFKALRCRHIPVDSKLLTTALELGTTHLLRSGDALFVAASKNAKLPLISWDEELVKKKLANKP